MREYEYEPGYAPSICQPPASEVTFWPPLNNVEPPPPPNFDVLTRHAKSRAKMRKQGKNNGEILAWLRKKGIMFQIPHLVAYWQKLSAEQANDKRKEQPKAQLQHNHQQNEKQQQRQTRARPKPGKAEYHSKSATSQNPQMAGGVLSTPTMADGKNGEVAPPPPRGGLAAVAEYVDELVQMRRDGDHIGEMLCFLGRKHIHATTAEVTRILEIHDKAVAAAEAVAEKEQVKSRLDQIKEHIGDLVKMRDEGKGRFDMIEWLNTRSITAFGDDLNTVLQEHDAEEKQKQKQKAEQQPKPNPLQLVGSLRRDDRTAAEAEPNAMAETPPQGTAANDEDNPPMARGNASAARTPSAFLEILGLSVDKVDAFLEGRPILKLEKAIEIGKYHAVHTFSSPDSTVHELKVANQTLSIAAAYEEAQARAADRQHMLKLREAAHELRVKKMAQTEARAKAAAERKAPKTFDNTARIAAFRKEYFKDVFTPENIALVKQAFAKAGVKWVSVPDDPDYVPPAGQPHNPP
jgi:hypothetical protein